MFFLVKCASILPKLKLSVIQATDNGNITNPLCKGDKLSFSCKYTGIYKLYPISVIAISKSVIKTRTIDMLNSFVGRNGCSILFSILNSSHKTAKAKIIENMLKII